jgi:hypothetical protein
VYNPENGQLAGSRGLDMSRRTRLSSVYNTSDNSGHDSSFYLCNSSGIRFRILGPSKSRPPGSRSVHKKHEDSLIEIGSIL